MAKLMKSFNISAEGDICDKDEALELVGGILIDSSIYYNAGSIGSPYWRNSSVKRVVCSCGNGKVNPDNPGYCKCGIRLLNLGKPSWRENEFTATAYVPKIEGEKMTVYKTDISCSPLDKKKFLQEDLMVFNIVFKFETAAEVVKDEDGTFIVDEKIPIAKIENQGENLLNFFGDSLNFMYNYNGYKFTSLFKLRQSAPNIITIENENQPFWNDIVKLTETAVKTGKPRKSHLKKMTAEELFEYCGYPVKYFPLTWGGRVYLEKSPEEIKEWAKTDIAQVIISRLLDGDDISPRAIRDLDSAPVHVDILLAYMKDTVDQYGVSGCLEQLSKRIKYLNSIGESVTLENLRTRSFCSKANADKYRIKKNLDGDVGETILKDPLEALKSLMMAK